MSKLFIRLDLKPGETWVVQEALKRYRRRCEQEIAAGEVWPHRRVIKTIRKMEADIADNLREVDIRYSNVPFYTFYVALDLDPDGIMTLTEALTRLLAQCEQDPENEEMRPLGSPTYSGFSQNVRHMLNLELRRTWKKIPLIKKPTGRASRIIQV